MNSPPRLRSLRWQLPFSYAAIALLAVLALGITLLGTLRGFYQEQELGYLAGNAVAIAEEIAPLLAAGDLVTLQAEIAAYSFLMQARVQVLDVAGQTVVADSGELSSLTPALSVDVGEPGLLEALGGVETDVAVVIEEQQQIEDGVIATERIITRTSLLPAQGSLYGFNLGGEPTAVTERSNLIEETMVVDDTGRLIGRLRLSQGPAYGGDILRSVAGGWLIAGSVAVLLAALTGWLVSRRLTQPLLALTAVTGRMAEGDLGARANVRRANELGILGQAFNRMAAQVENTVQSLRQFTADAAHELHTPLTALQTDLQLLESGADSAQRPRLARAQAQARRLQDLADSLLELSRLEAAAADGVQSVLNLTQLVQAAGELAASQAEQMDLTLALQLPEQPVMVRGDESQLQRALLNVLDNSLKFTPPPGEIVLALAVAGETAVITVCDSGIGIPPEDMPQLFSRFHRGRNTADYPGSGLGLAIVQEIMARHNGRVAIESGEAGTKVRLILPGES
jgi:signal transduction histidine kinase